MYHARCVFVWWTCAITCSMHSCGYSSSCSLTLDSWLHALYCPPNSNMHCKLTVNMLEGGGCVKYSISYITFFAGKWSTVRNFRWLWWWLQFGQWSSSWCYDWYKLIFPTVTLIHILPFYVSNSLPSVWYSNEYFVEIFVNVLCICGKASIITTSKLHFCLARQSLFCT